MRAALALLLLATPATAGDGVPDLRFSVGLGASASPGYFGSDEVEFGPTGLGRFGYVNLGPFELGQLERGEQRGASVGLAFRYLAARKAEDYPELAGLTDIDWTAEVGASASYTADAWYVFGELRYGVNGHEELVGTLGADAILRPTDRWTLRAGPRIEIGSAGFNQTYFGVTDAEAGASAFNAYTPDAGLYAAGVQFSAEYEFAPAWSVVGTLAYQRLIGEAADSPIVEAGSDDYARASVVLVREFTLDLR